MKAADWSEFLSRFEVPGSEGRLYVLGCFARHLTLYSQQVRALNLIRALCDADRVAKGTRVAVIGGGAAGLTAAAAATVRKARVTVFEKLDGLMELQLNNRQRWLHPHIYDWPDMRDDTSDAGLPLLNWQADYAAGVAGQILQGWESLIERPEVKTGVEQLRITMEGSVKLNWGPPAAEFDVVIFAVGFGLEPHKQEIGQWSYWSEDDTDGDFRRPSPRQRWLVSGTGDGALTDIMRLSIHRFRHANILSLVEGVAGVEQLKNKLRDLHKLTDEKVLQEEFLAIEQPELREKLVQQLRQNGPLVTMVGVSVYQFGPKASVLNRLIVSQLYRVMNPRKEFLYFPGPTRRVRRLARTGKFRVEIEGLEATEYDRVILRYGPDRPVPLRASFPEVWKACAKAKMPQLWESTPHYLDLTRSRLFEAEDPDFFRVDRAVQKAGAEPAIVARSMSVSKQVRSDGSSTLSYKVEGLRGVDGVRVELRSACGIFGEPVCDPGAVWQGTSGRTLSGVFQFEKAPGRPANFGFTVELLNGDALSRWQYRQMYGEKADARESLPVVAPFAAESLKVRVTLPTRIAAAPVLRAFEAQGVTLNGGIVNLTAETDRSEWKGELAGPAKAQVVRDALQAWELSVAKVATGARYALDWELPGDELEGELREVADAASEVRRRLVEHRRRVKDSAVQDAFAHFAGEVKGRFAQSGEELFEVTAMTYDDGRRQLRFFEGIVNGKPLSSRSWNFSLPFGLGLAGACFKEAGRAFFYERPEQTGAQPEIYLRVADGAQHEVLLALPLIHPGVARLAPGGLERSGADRSRFCIGVVNIGSDRVDSSLRGLRENYTKLVELWAVCQRFADVICDRMKV